MDGANAAAQVEAIAGRDWFDLTDPDCSTLRPLGPSDPDLRPAGPGSDLVGDLSSISRWTRSPIRHPASVCSSHRTAQAGQLLPRASRAPTPGEDHPACATATTVPYGCWVAMASNARAPGLDRLVGSHPGGRRPLSR